MKIAQQTMGSCSASGVKLIAIVMAVGVSVYILGPPLYWHFVDGREAAIDIRPSCPACICDCASDLAAISTPISGLGNISLADCLKDDPDMREELDKTQIQLLTEEIKLQQIVSEENQQRAELAFLDAKKIASQYQKEAEKCNTGMETSEEAREKAEAALIAERKRTALWERRARSMGWKDKDEGSKEEVVSTTNIDGKEESMIDRVSVQDVDGGDMLTRLRTRDLRGSRSDEAASMRRMRHMKQKKS